jgi:hypothetical protein
MLFMLQNWLIAAWMTIMSPQHPFYLSMTELAYNETQQSLEISVRIFSDDLERALRKQCNCNVDLLNIENQSVNTVHLQQYINSHLQIKSQGKLVKLEWVGFEHEQESTWIYLEAKHIAKGNKLLIYNDLLYEILDAQVNLVRFKTKEIDRTWQLVKPNTNVEIFW